LKKFKTYWFLRPIDLPFCIFSKEQIVLLRLWRKATVDTELFSIIRVRVAHDLIIARNIANRHVLFPSFSIFTSCTTSGSGASETGVPFEGITWADSGAIGFEGVGALKHEQSATAIPTVARNDL
jgi:hypothetical protein